MARRSGMTLPVVLVAFAPANAALPEPLVLHYEIYAVAGLPILTFDFQVDEANGTYRITSRGRSNGLIGWFSGFAMRAQSDGAVAGGGLQPTTYETTSRSHAGDRFTHLDYRGDGSVAAIVTPPEEPSGTAVKAGQIPGTVDPLTAILAMGHQVAETGRCAGRVAVFDGRRRYDVVLNDDGAERFAPSAGYPYSGEVKRCTVEMVKLAGFSTDPRFYPHSDRGRVWLAQLRPGAPAVPVRLEFPSAWGDITARMAKDEAAK